MKNVGIFEAKTKLSELCATVSERGECILITRRGQPIAELHPPTKPTSISIWDARRTYDKAHGSQEKEADFELPERKAAKGQYASWTDKM